MTSSPNGIGGFISAATATTSPVLRSIKKPASFVVPTSDARPKHLIDVSPSSTVLISLFQTTAVASLFAFLRLIGRLL